jgi:hypothetical protein
MKKFKAFMAVGDILVAINDRVVIDESFTEVSNIIDMLM